MNSSAIFSRPLQIPDWLALRCLPPRPCAEAIQAILAALEGADRFVYAIRGEALRLFDERQLYREFNDPATNEPCTCTDRFLKVYMPDSWRYCEEALRNRQKLQATVPLEAAIRMTRANLRLLEGASESVASKPEVHEAGAEQTEEQFAGTLSKDYNQHIEARRTFKATYSAGEYAEVESYLLRVCGRIGIEANPGAALLALAIDDRMEHLEAE